MTEQFGGSRGFWNLVLRVARRVASVFDHVLTVFNKVASICTFVLMLTVSVDVLGRIIFNRPIPGAYEIAEMLMVVIVFFSLAFCEAKDQHIRVEVISMHLPRRAQLLLSILAYIAGMFLFGLIGFGSGKRAVASWIVREYSAGIVPTPLYPVKFVVPLGSFFLFIRFLISAIYKSVSLFSKVR